MSDSFWFWFFKSPCHKCPPKPRPQGFPTGSRNRGVRTVEMIQSDWLVLTRSLLGLTFRHKDCPFVHECSRASLGPVCCWQEETLKKERDSEPRIPYPVFRREDIIDTDSEGERKWSWDLGHISVWSSLKGHQELKQASVLSPADLRSLSPSLWRGGSRCLFWTKELQSLCLWVHFKAPLTRWGYI